MKKLLLICGLISAMSFLPSLACGEDQCNYYAKNITATDPTKLSEKQFYDAEKGLILGFSGSGGYFLGKEEIDWLKKAVAALEAKGIKLKDEYHRAIVYGDSYFQLKEYKKSIEEYNAGGELGGSEEVEWFLNNGDFKGGRVKIVEYPGKIPYKSSEVTKVEDGRYLFVSHFKGPVYRYDKGQDKHAVIYAPDRYDWVVSLKWDGKRLEMKCRDLGERGDKFEFNNATNALKKKVTHRNIFRAYVEGL